MLIYVVLMRDWYIVSYRARNCPNEWKRDGWTGGESHWGWQAGDLRLELQQIQLKSVRSVDKVATRFLWNATLNLQILIYVSLEAHRLQQKHGKLHHIWPQTSQGGDFCQQNSFQAFFSHLNKLYSLAADDSDQSFASPSRSRNTAFPFLHGRGFTSWQMTFDITVLC